MLRIISLRTTSQYHNIKTLSLIFRPISYWGGSSYTLVEVGFIISSPIVWRILHMKFLKAVRLDDSDAHVYAAEGGAAVDGEWMVSGGYAVCDLAKGHRTTPCHCGTSFVSVGSHGRCTIAEVCHIEPHEYEASIKSSSGILLRILVRHRRKQLVKRQMTNALTPPNWQPASQTKSGSA